MEAGMASLRGNEKSIEHPQKDAPTFLADVLHSFSYTPVSQVFPFAATLASVYSLLFIHLCLASPAIVSQHSSFYPFVFGCHLPLFLSTHLFAPEPEILVTVFSLCDHDRTHLYDIVV
jgi:hypothetical protein